jgi:uncharacterized protein (DUF2235 family)
VRHALALDERRAAFRHLAISKVSQTSTEASIVHIKEVWFAGTHSEVYDACKESELQLIIYLRIAVGAAESIWTLTLAIYH